MYAKGLSEAHNVIFLELDKVLAFGHCQIKLIIDHAVNRIHTFLPGYWKTLPLPP